MHKINGMRRYTFLLTFRNGETRTVSCQDTDEESAQRFVWANLPGRDQDRLPSITLTVPEACHEAMLTARAISQNGAWIGMHGTVIFPAARQLADYLAGKATQPIEGTT